MVKKLAFQVFLLLLISSFSNSGCVNAQFVQVKGTQLMLDQKPYYFCGTNFWYGYYLGSKGKTGDRERLKRELDKLKSIGISNLRILASSETSISEGTLSPVIQTSPGVYNEELLDGLDFLLAEMGKRNMKAVLYLNNFWQWSGGMSQYVSWVTGEPVVDPAKGEWGKFYDQSTSFYSNPKAIELNRKYISMLVKRKNNYTGKPYRDDAAIMAWQLANEPRGGEGKNGISRIDDFYKWIDETAGFIHALDPNHLVTAGSEGTIGTRGNENYFLKAYQTPNINYLTFHLWAKNWGWFNAMKYKETVETSKVKAAAYIDLQIQIARKLGKPVVMEEFGLDRDSAGCTPETPVTARNEYYKFVFNLLSDSAMQKAPIAGSNFWGWAGEGRPVTTDGKKHDNSPFLADPWQEPQGLNSVFDCDISTISIIEKHAREMNSLSK